MKHPSPEEIVDAFDGAPASRVAAHLSSCEPCRRRADSLAAMRDAVRDVDVPEPSPLFWQQFAARVSEAARSSGPARQPWSWKSWRGARWPWSLAAAAVLVVGVAASLVLKTGPRLPLDVTPPVAGSSPAPADGATIDEEAPWVLIADVTDEMDWDTVAAAGLAPMPGTADRAVTHLSDTERAELGRLLAREMAAPAAQRTTGGSI